MIKIFITFIFFLGISTLNFATALSSCNGTKTNPCIVQDTENNKPDVKHWRDANDIATAFAEKNGNVKGLNNLWISGSAEPSTEGWKTIAVKIIQTTDNKVEHIIDVDLRQESHGYLNENAITLAALNDWANLGKSREQVLKDEKNWLKSINQNKTISNVLTQAQFKKDQFTKGNTIKIESVASEEKIAKAARFEYFRLTVTDHMAPRDADVDRFVAFVKNLKENTWLHFHCREGEGRTTTFMAMYDMLKNANKVPVNVIIKRQAAIEPYCDLFETTRKNSALSDNYKKRKAFLLKFYQFSQASLKGYKGSWSEWVRQTAKPL